MNKLKVASLFQIVLSFAITTQIRAAENLLSDQSSLWSVTLGAPVSCSDCVTGSNQQISIESQSNPDTFNLLVNGNVSRITSISLSDNYLSVIGNLAFGGQSVSFYSLSDRELLTEFYGYDIHTSPDGRYYIYRKYFPRMAANNDSVVMLFDVSELSSDDRSYLENVEPENVGIPIYPPQSRSLDLSLSYEGTTSFSLIQVLFNRDASTATFPIIDKDGNISIATLQLWQQSFTDSLNVCSVPLISHSLQSSSYSEPIKHTVEEVHLAENPNVYSVSLYDTRGVKTQFQINMDFACQ